MSITVIIAAMHRELQPFVQGWNQVSLEYKGHKFQGFETNRAPGEKLVAVVSGMGCELARLAAKAAVGSYKPRVLASVGLAGALMPSLKVGNVITPNVIINGATGEQYRCAFGQGVVVGGGIIVSAGDVAGLEAKQALVKRFHALAVDMEAAGVAEVADQEQIFFRCVKVISDEAGFAMPPMGDFVNDRGEFQTGRFLGWAGVRPAVWPTVLELGRNSRRAVRALCDWLKKDGFEDVASGPVVKLQPV
ncbi:MAG TPA: hypothetical protein VKZ53_05865 [Candidatus Angelobacter sp.]|nr:hypothetical protein [Candidatus Angelobacter sp.]